MITGTATAGLDFQNAFGPLTFHPGQTSRDIVVPILGDLTGEADETFRVRLANPSHGEILDGEGKGTILNDDALAGVLLAGVLTLLTSQFGSLVIRALVSA